MESQVTPVEVPAAELAELQAFSAEVERLVAGAPGPNDLPVDVARKLQADTAPPPSPRAEQIEVEVDGHRVGVRVLPPVDGGRGIGLLHIHGGGWTMGGADQQDERLERIGADLGAVVVSVEYRLAPEHPHPAAADDCETAARWLGGLGRRELGVETLLISGDSAGAHLAVLTMQRLRDRYGITDVFAGADLRYGLYDLALTPSVVRRGDRRIILSRPIIEYHVAALLGSGTRADDPEVSPLHGDLSELPPALFSVGADDPLLDDSVLMARRWAESGNVAELDVYEAGFHAFDLFPLAIAERCRRRQVGFLRRCADPARISSEG